MLPFALTRNPMPTLPGHELVEFDRQQINLFAAQVQRCEAHWHAAAELIHVLQGRFAIRLDQHSQELGPGGMLYINQERIHELQALEPDSQLLTVQFSPHLFNDLQPALLIDYQVADSLHYSARDREIKAALKQLVEQQLQGTDRDPFRRIALIYLLLSSLQQANAGPRQPPPEPLRSKDQQLIKHCIDYIHCHYERELPLAEVAAQGPPQLPPLFQAVQKGQRLQFQGLPGSGTDQPRALPAQTYAAADHRDQLQQRLQRAQATDRGLSHLLRPDPQRVPQAVPVTTATRLPRCRARCSLSGMGQPADGPAGPVAVNRAAATCPIEAALGLQGAGRR
ncbi:MAG: AraC family ligand binding domain-containing protein [Candidatus Pseudomonas colombiensis]|nr:MAG: AraC family ligand binding domain-containing protein [Pseudomonas sp.]